MITMLDKINLFKDEDFEYFFKFIKNDSNFNELWRMKSLARETLKEWLIATHLDVETAENCANACSELIENCIKFSLVDEYSYVLILVDNDKITVETINKSEEEKIKILQKNFDCLLNKDIDDITDMYITKLTENTTENSEKSQLGIIKIKLETNADFQLVKRDEKNIVHIKLTMDTNKTTVKEKIK